MNTWTEKAKASKDELYARRLRDRISMNWPVLIGLVMIILPFLLLWLLAGCASVPAPMPPAVVDHPAIQQSACVRMGQTVLCGT